MTRVKKYKLIGNLFYYVDSKYYQLEGVKGCITFTRDFNDAIDPYFKSLDKYKITGEYGYGGNKTIIYLETIRSLKSSEYLNVHITDKISRIISIKKDE